MEMEPCVGRVHRSEPVASALREAAFPKMPTGAAHVKLASRLASRKLGKGWFLGNLCFAHSADAALQQSGWQELSSQLVCYEVTSDGAAHAIEEKKKRSLLRTLLHASPRIKPPADHQLISALTAFELRLFQELRRSSDEQIVAGVRNVVTPLFAGKTSD
jgi:hypothetical protein